MPALPAALVTGAAAGIGAACARALAEQGRSVALLDRDPHGLAETADLLRTAGARVSPHVVDVRDPGAVEAAVAAAEQALGEVAVAVAAAGVLHAGSALSTPPAEWAALLEVNLLGVVATCTATTSRMASRRRGSVVVVSSDAATVARTGLGAYAASKAAALAWSRALGLELAESGVRVNAVCPGATDTAMQRSLWVDDCSADAVAAGDPARFRVPIPLGRIATPDQVAAAVAFLASDAASHITLQSLHVDGGASLHA